MPHVEAPRTALPSAARTRPACSRLRPAAALLAWAAACQSPVSEPAPESRPQGPLPERAPEPLAALDKAPGVETVWEYLLARYDSNANGTIERDEYTRDNWFRLDLDGDGRLAPEEIQGRSMIPSGPVRERFLLTSFSGYLLQADDDPARFERRELAQALEAYDTSGDGAIGRDELEMLAAQRGRLGLKPDLLVQRTASGSTPWELLATRDTNADERLSLTELEALFDDLDPHDPGLPRAADGVLYLTPPPRATPGELAPDFALLPPGCAVGAAPIQLSAFRGQRPVALIFGSYT